MGLPAPYLLPFSPTFLCNSLNLDSDVVNIFMLRFVFESRIGETKSRLLLNSCSYIYAVSTCDVDHSQRSSVELYFEKANIINSNIFILSMKFQSKSNT